MTSIQQLNRSDDLRRLRDENYDVTFVNSHLILRNVPYLTADRKINRGILVVAKLNMAGEVTAKPQNHEMVWVGELPQDLRGQNLSLGARAADREIAKDLIGKFQFSFKIKRDEQYVDYYEMFTTYYNCIAGPACPLTLA